MNIELLSTKQDVKIGWFMVEGVEYGVSLSRTLYDVNGDRLSYTALCSDVVDEMVDKLQELSGRVYY
jgi:hypothetical protein